MIQPGDGDGGAPRHGPGSADRQALRMASLLRPICLWMLALFAVLGLLAFHPLLRPSAPAIWLGTGPLAGALVLALVLLEAGRVRTAAGLFTAAGWLVLAGIVVFRGGLQGPNPAILVAFGVLVGVLWGFRGILVYTGVTLLGATLLLVAEIRGLAPGMPPEMGPANGWVVLASTLVIAGLVTWLSQRTHDQLLAASQRNERTALDASRAEEEGRWALERRVEQQAAVADLGQRALADEEVDGLLWEAARAVGRTLAVEYVSILQLRPEEDVLVLRAGVGWPEGAYDGVRFPVAESTQASHTLRTRKSVVVEDLARDARFPINSGLLNVGIASSVSAVILGEGDEPFGVIAAHALARRAFLEEDVHFLEAVGHLVALAIRRDRGARTLRAREAELRQSQKMEAVGRLAGGVAHDFNNLLTAIAGYAGFLLQELDAEHPARGDAEEILRLTDQAASLTRQILSFSRPQMMRADVVDLNAVIRDAEGLLRRTIGEDVEFRTRLAEGEAPVRADAAQLEQVLLNLVVNARDAMPGGGILEVRTALERDPDDGPMVRLEVTDTGCGMDAETRARAFDPFFTTKERFKGTGLGLSTVYGIVQQHRGSVSIASEPGRGTTLRILLPASRGRPRSEARRVAPLPPGGTETILLAEDDPAVRRLMRRVLDGAGYAVLEAADGSQALALAREHAGPIHLVLTDVVMPEMGGAELVERLETEHPEARILDVSGYAEDAGPARGTLPRGGALLAKPFNAADLARRVRAVLDAPALDPDQPSEGAGTPS